MGEQATQGPQAEVIELSVRRLRIERAESKTPGVQYDDEASRRAIDALLRSGVAAFAEKLWVKFPHDLDDAGDHEERLEQHLRRVEYLGHAPPSSFERLERDAQVVTLDRLSLFFRLWPKPGVPIDRAAATLADAIRLELWPDFQPKGLGDLIFAQTVVLERELRTPTALPLDLSPRDYQESWLGR